MKVLALHRIGIRHGRLLADNSGMPFSFSDKKWEEEFYIASKLNLSIFEFSIGGKKYKNHPIFSHKGRNKIVRIIKETNVKVPYLCCDVLMEYCLTNRQTNRRKENINLLKEIFYCANEIGIKKIQIPLFGRASIKKKEDEHLIVDSLRQCTPLADKLGVKILLETDLTSKALCHLLDMFDGKVQATYDAGNITYFGYNHEEEILALGTYIQNVHIKDCTKEDYSVPLGTGDTPFDVIFKNLKKICYQGDFILETVRCNVENKAREYIDFTQKHINEYLS